MPTDDPGIDGEEAIDGADVIDAASERVRGELVRFVRTLGRAGVELPANAALPAGEALAEVGLDDRRRARAALRAALVTRPADVDRFDRLFPAFWRRLRAAVEEPWNADDRTRGGEDADGDGGLDLPEVETPSTGDSADDGGDEPDEGPSSPSSSELTTRADADGEPRSTARYSPGGRSERLEAVPTAGDDETAAAVRRLTRALASQPGRRSESTAAGGSLDARRALRESVETGGAPFSLPERTPRETEVRGLVLADVSRSVLDVLERRFAVAFLRALRAEWRSLRAFLFDTDVREVTDALDAEGTAAAYAALADAEVEWGGGTRIGHALASVRERDPHAVDRRTVVVVVSDGLEMGDVSELADGMAWLARRAPLVLWFNPLAASPDYEPTASGMAAALPYVDGLFAFTGPADVDEIARQLETRGRAGPLGYRHDGRGHA